MTPEEHGMSLADAGLVNSARAALAHWPLIGQVNRISPVWNSGFSGALVFQVSTKANLYALRRWPNPGLVSERIRELHRFLRFVYDAGVTEVAVPLAGKAGSLIEHDGYRWQLEPWKRGVALFLKLPTDLRLESAMRCLARLHVVAARYEPTAGGREWFCRALAAPSPSVSERLSRLAACDANRLRVLLSADRSRKEQIIRWFEWVAPTVRRELASVASTPLLLHPCLRDIWSEHVLYTAQVVSGIIDPSATRTENVACDLSRLLGSFLPEGGERWESALAAYSDVRPLSMDERRLVRILDRSGVLLSTLHWVEQFSAHSRLAQNQHATSRYATVLQRLERLAGEIGKL